MSRPSTIVDRPIWYAVSTSTRVTVGQRRQRAVDVLLERDDLAAPPQAVRRQHRLGAGVVHAITNGLGGKSTEDHRVSDPQAGARQQRHHQLGHHGHIDGAAVAGPEAQREERVGQPTDLGVQLGIGERPLIARLPLPDQRRLFGARRQVAIEAVGRDVELTIGEPAHEGRAALVEDFGERARPQELARLFGPERRRIFFGRRTQRVDQLLRPQPGAGGKIGRRLEAALLMEERFEVGVALGLVLGLTHREGKRNARRTPGAVQIDFVRSVVLRCALFENQPFHPRCEARRP